MAKNMPLLKKKLVEKMASIHDTKDTFVTMLEEFVTEADEQFSRLLSVKEESFFVESYMNIMQIMDEFLNSCVMLTAHTDTLQGNFLKSMNDLLASFTTSPDLDINDNSDLASCQRLSTKKSDSDTTCKQIFRPGYNHDKTGQKHQSLPVKYSFVSSQTDICTDHKALEEDSWGLNKNMSELDFNNHNEKTKGPNRYAEVYIGNFDSTVVQEDVTELVQDFHPINVRYRRNKENTRKVFAFVAFSHLSDAENCIKAVDGCKHKGRVLKCRLNEDYFQKQDSSSEISTENDSCYNSLVEDLRGNFSLCYPKNMEALDITKEELAKKFWEFGDFSEIHFSSRMIFVRFKSKGSAVAAVEKYSQKLGLRVAELGSLKKCRKYTPSTDSWETYSSKKPSFDSESYSSQQTEEMSPESYGYCTEQTSPESYQGVPSMKTQAPSTDASNHSTEDHSIKVSYFNQLKKIMKDKTDNADNFCQ